MIRGPATLRWGSQAIGGVVNVDNNRIPTAIPPRGFAGELNGAVTTVDRGLEGSVLLDAGGGNIAVDTDAYGRRAGDYGIPSYPYLFPPAPAPTVNGRQPNSAFHSSCMVGPGGEFRQIVYSQRDATFRGGEVQAQFDATPLGTGMLGVDGQYDIVHATFADGTNVPRIPPQRIGGGVYWRSPDWFVRVGLLHAFAQNRTAALETTTDGYNLLKAEISHTKRLAPSDVGPREVTFGIVGNNLLNDDVRNSVSFKKDEVLLPGLNVRFFASMRY